MNISDLIEVLEDAKEEHGDLPIKCNITGVGFMAETEALRKDLIEVKEDRKGTKIIKIGD